MVRPPLNRLYQTQGMSSVTLQKSLPAHKLFRKGSACKSAKSECDGAKLEGAEAGYSLQQNEHEEGKQGHLENHGGALFSKAPGCASASTSKQQSP